MGATNRLHAGLGQTEMPDLAFANQIADRARDVFDRHVRIDAMLIEQIDSVGLEPLQRCLGHVADVGGPAVEARLLAVLELEAELRGDDDLIANRSERLSDEFFVRERPVRFCGVEERHARVDRGAHDADAVLTTRRLPVAEADPHAPEAECRHLQSAGS